MSKIKKRPDGLYQISVMVEEGGRRKRKYFYGHTQQEAKRKMMAWQEEKAAGRTFGEVAEEWQTAHWPEISAGTRTSYAPALRRALDAFSSTLIAEITPADVKRSIDAMAAQGYAHHSVVIYRSVLNQIFARACFTQEIRTNPADYAAIPRGLSTSERTCPTDTQCAMIRANVGHPFGLFPYMLLYTGLRRGELLALQWKDIDFDGRTIRVTKSVTYAETGNQPQLKSPKTESGVRDVVLLERLSTLLLPLRQAGDAYVFGGKEPLTQSVFRDRWKNYCIDVGLWEWREVTETVGRKKVSRRFKAPSVTPHQLRHAFATMCFEAGVTPKDAQELLGHSKIDVTLDTYTHIRKKRRQDVADRLNKAE